MSIDNKDSENLIVEKVVKINRVNKVVKGGIILFDNYEGVGTGGTFYKGETETINKFLKKINKKAIKFSIYNRPSYIIK